MNRYACDRQILKMDFPVRSCGLMLFCPVVFVNHTSAKSVSLQKITVGMIAQRTSRCSGYFSKGLQTAVFVVVYYHGKREEGSFMQYKNWHRLLFKTAVVLTALFCLTGTAAGYLPTISEMTVSAATEGDLVYELTTQNEVTITGYQGKGGEVTVPAEISGKPVTEIGDKAFHGCNTITKITFPNTLKTIGERAFWYCTELESTNLPEGLSTIRPYAFFNCSKLCNIVFPKGLKTIGGFAFSGCAALSEVALPEGVTSIGTSAFDATEWYGKQSSGEVYIGKYLYRYKGAMPEFYRAEIPTDTKLIADGAFSGCENLQTAVIPEGITRLGASTFFGCKTLQTITLPETLKSIGTQVFCQCTKLEEIIIPEKVTLIENGAFAECTDLKRIVMFDGIRQIGTSAAAGTFNSLPFESCHKLDKLVYVGSEESFKKIETDSVTRSVLASVAVFVEPKEYSPEKIATYGSDRPAHPDQTPDSQLAPIMKMIGVDNEYDFMMLIFYVIVGVLVLVIVIAVLVHFIRKKKHKEEAQDDEPQLPKWR